MRYFIGATLLTFTCLACIPQNEPASGGAPAADPQKAGAPAADPQKAGDLPASVSNADYDLAMFATPGNALAVGGRGTINLEITPKKDWNLKLDTPYEVNLSASPGGLTLDKTALGISDFVDPKAHAKTASCGVVANKAGNASVDADLEFYLCNPEICKKFKAQTRLPITVE